MATLTDLQAFRRALDNRIRRNQFGSERRMITGKRIDDETVSMAGAPVGQFWVRSTDDSREERAVWGEISQPNVRVIIDLNSDGEYEFKRLDYYAARQAFGPALHALTLPRIASSVVRLLLEGKDFKPGRVRVWTPGTLIVNAAAFWYRDSTGARKKWIPGDTNALTLTAPAASGGVDQHRWTVIALNPDATSPALVAFDGTSYATPMPLIESESGDIAVTAGYYVLGAVQVETGDTTLDESDFIEPREFLSSIQIGTYYQTLQDNGSAQTQRRVLNFIAGTNVTLTITDNSGNDSTDVEIAASGGGGGAVEYFSASVTSNTSMTSAAMKVPYATEAADPYSVYDNSTYRFTAATTGIYIVSFSVCNNTYTGKYLELRKNGSTLGSKMFGILGTIGDSRPISLSAGDYLEVWCAADASWTLLGGYASFSAIFVGT